MFGRNQAAGEQAPTIVISTRPRMRAMLLAGTAGAALAYLFDPVAGTSRRTQTVDRLGGLVRRTERRAQRRRRALSARAHGLRQRMTHLREEPKDFDDGTLLSKIESEVFGQSWFPKGAVNAGVVGGVVELRGAVGDQQLIHRIERTVAKVHGVRGVGNLLHTPGRPAPNKVDALRATRRDA